MHSAQRHREAERLFAEGQRQARGRNWEAAERAFQEAVRLFPSDARFALHLALLNAETGRASKGLEILRRHGTKPVLLLFQALLAVEANRFTEAEAALQQAEAQAPKNVLLPTLRALLALRRDGLGEGLRCLGNGPLCENPLILARLVRELDRLQPDPPPLPPLRPVAPARRPRSPQGWYRWGLRWMEEERWLRRILRGPLQDWKGLTSAWEAYRQTMERAAQALEQAFRQNPSLPEVAFYAVASWFEARRFQQAWALLEPLLHQENKEARKRQAALSSEAGDWEALYAAALHLHRHEPEAAAEWFPYAPPGADTEYYRARWRMEQGKPEAALPHYQRAIEQDPTLPRRRVVEAIAFLCLTHPEEEPPCRCGPSAGRRSSLA